MRRAGSSWYNLLWVVLVSAVAALAGCDRSKQETSQSAGPKYRLVRVVIPQDSAHRSNADLNHPPLVYAMIYKNGDQVGKCSQSVKGWECEFSQQDDNNRYTIDDANATYMLQLWDDQYGGDRQILSTTGLRQQDFEKPIRENLSITDPADRAVTIVFEHMK